MNHTTSYDGTIKEKEQESGFTYFGFRFVEHGFPLPELHSFLEWSQRLVQEVSSTLVMGLINNDQSSLMKATMTQIMRKTILTDQFGEVFDTITILKCKMVVSYLDLFLVWKGLANCEYVLGVHDLSEDQYVEKTPYVEVRVPVKEANVLLNIWEESLKFLEKNLSEEMLEEIDIFFTRA